MKTLQTKSVKRKVQKLYVTKDIIHFPWSYVLIDLCRNCYFFKEKYTLLLKSYGELVFIIYFRDIYT